VFCDLNFDFWDIVTNLPMDVIISFFLVFADCSNFDKNKKFSFLPIVVFVFAFAVAVVVFLILHLFVCTLFDCGFFFCFSFDLNLDFVCFWIFGIVVTRSGSI